MSIKKQTTNKNVNPNDTSFMKLVDAIGKLPSILKYGSVVVLAIVLVVLRGTSLSASLLWFLGINILACLFTFAFIDVFKFINIQIPCDYPKF